jgi:hypothetical protein
LLLQNPKQFYLHLGREFRDLIQKDGPSIGKLESALLLAHGAGKRSSDMAEQFTFQNALRQGAAIDGDKGLIAPRSQVVNGCRNQLLPSSTFTLDEHGHFYGGNLPYQVEKKEHFRILADQPSEGVMMPQTALQGMQLGVVFECEKKAYGISGGVLKRRRGYVQNPDRTVRPSEFYVFTMILPRDSLREPDPAFRRIRKNIGPVAAQDVIAPSAGDVFRGLVEMENTSRPRIRSNAFPQVVENELEITASRYQCRKYTGGKEHLYVVFQYLAGNAQLLCHDLLFFAK